MVEVIAVEPGRGQPEHGKKVNSNEPGLGPESKRLWNLGQWTPSTQRGEAANEERGGYAASTLEGPGGLGPSQRGEYIER